MNNDVLVNAFSSGSRKDDEGIIAGGKRYTTKIWQSYFISGNIILVHYSRLLHPKCKKMHEMLFQMLEM